jgi:hypothetical protein
MDGVLTGMSDWVGRDRLGKARRNAVHPQMTSEIISNDMSVPQKVNRLMDECR